MTTLKEMTQTLIELDKQIEFQKFFYQETNRNLFSLQDFIREKTRNPDFFKINEKK